MIRTLADTIIWMAQERQKSPKRCQNENSAIHSVLLDIKQLLMEHMAANDNRERMMAAATKAWLEGSKHGKLVSGYTS